MELSILHAIQKLSSPVLDWLMVTVSSWGNGGTIWIIITLFLLCKKDYRKTGIVMAISLFISVMVGNLFLKNLVARSRPCWVDESVKLLIANPRDYSFPSGHTFSSFAAACSIFFNQKKMGYYALFLAVTIAFSRLYLFVHYPTDVLGGAILGGLTAYLVTKLCNRYLVM